MQFENKVCRCIYGRFIFLSFSCGLAVSTDRAIEHGAIADFVCFASPGCGPTGCVWPNGGRRARRQSNDVVAELWCII
jgi:hypothetical protein